jgi:Fe-S-cluster containining protein
MQNYKQTERKRAIQRGMEYIRSHIWSADQEEYAGSDLLYFLSFLASTAADQELRQQAQAMGEDFFQRWRRAQGRFPAQADVAVLTEWVHGYHAAERLGLHFPRIKQQLRQAAPAFTAEEYLWFDPQVEPPPADVPEVCACGTANQRGQQICQHCRAPLTMMSRIRVWLIACTLTYCGERYGVLFGARYVDVLQWLPALRDYPTSTSATDFYDTVYALTHLVYTINDYGRYQIPPAWLPAEYAFLRDQMEAAISLDDPDMIGEFLDALMGFGMSDRHPVLRRGIDYLLARQNPDGSWGDASADTASSWLQFHATWTAIDGLRAFAWQGEGVSLPDVKQVMLQWRQEAKARNRLTAPSRPAPAAKRRALPVLNFSPFRRYPTKQERQRFVDDQAVCSHCLSGACCSSEDPIYLSSFDILRLAAFFDQTPAEFMLNFTQDQFDGEDSQLRRRAWIDDPDSSIVTYLRRRENRPSSPCIFLKYIREADGTARRICSVHDARPLSCREYYHDTCRTRHTGELASLLAEGFEKVRDGEITDELVDKNLARFAAHDWDTAPLRDSFEFNFWLEMKRVLHPDEANDEGARSYRMSDYQDPIDEKLNRVLSSRFLRFEEKYGPVPYGEQLMPYSSGRSFAGSSEHQRLMRVLKNKPTGKLFSRGNYPHYVALRSFMPNVKPAATFCAIPAHEMRSFLRRLPAARLFPQHDLPEVRQLVWRDVYHAVLQGCNHLLHTASYVATLGNVLEFEPPGTLERDILRRLTNFATSRSAWLAANPYFRPVIEHNAAFILQRLTAEAAIADTPDKWFDLLRGLSVVQPAAPLLTPELRSHYRKLARLVNSQLDLQQPQQYAALRKPLLSQPDKIVGDWIFKEQQWQDLQCAAQAGFQQVNLQTWYEQALARVEALPFKQANAGRLDRLIKALAGSMTNGNRIAPQRTTSRSLATRLASFGQRFYAWLETTDSGLPKSRWSAQYLRVIGRGFGMRPASDPTYGKTIYDLLNSQSADGSWNLHPLPDDAPQSQADLLFTALHATWDNVDALRPQRHDGMPHEKEKPA